MFLKKIMEQRGLSQRRLSIMANISSQDFNQAINGKKPFFPSWRKRIAAALRLPEDKVFPEYSPISKIK